MAGENEIEMMADEGPGPPPLALLPSDAKLCKPVPCLSCGAVVMVAFDEEGGRGPALDVLAWDLAPAPDDYLLSGKDGWAVSTRHRCREASNG